jgi:hypothetical protein
MFISIISFIILMLCLGTIESIMMKDVTSNRIVFTSETGAVIKLGAMISDIRGTLQNGVYSLAKGGIHYVKSIPASVTNPNSEDQNTARRALMTAAKGWYLSLTAAQRAGWEELAQMLSGMTSEGNGGVKNLVPPVGMKGSGINAFCAFGARSTLAGLYGSFSNDAPLGETPPTPPLNVAATYDNVSGYLTPTWTDPLISDASAVIAIWLVTHQKLFHKQITHYIGLAVGTHDIAAARGALGKWISLNAATPFEVSIQLQTVNPSGWASPGSEVVQVVCS